MKKATVMGARKPAVVARKFIMPYKVAAKFGAKSCAFTKLVIVEAPLKPRQAIMHDTVTIGFCAIKGSAIRNAPGRKCAVKDKS